MMAEPIFETNQQVLRKIFDMVWLAVSIEVTATGIHGPDRIRDLTTYKFIVGITRSKRDVNLTL